MKHKGVVCALIIVFGYALADGDGEDGGATQ